MKTLISAQPTVWDVTNTYLKKSDKAQLTALRKIKQRTLPKRKKLIVESQVDSKITKAEFNLNKDGEYYNGGQSLTSLLEILAALGNSKVTIYEGKGN